MPKLPSVKPKDLLKSLLKSGFQVRAQQGSHCNLKHPDGRRVTIPMHNKDIKPGTLRNIMKQLIVTKEQFVELLNQ